MPPITGGMNDNPNFLMVGADQAYNIRNCHIDGSGMVYSRRGSRKVNATAMSGKVTSIYEWRRPYGTSTRSTILVTSGRWLYSINATTGATTQLAYLSTEDRPTWASFPNASGTSCAYMANGTDFFIYDGTTVSSACADPPWTNCAPRYIKAYGDRLLASGCDSDPYKVFVSDQLDGTDFKPASGAALYWTVKNIKGERVSGLGLIYNFAVFFQASSTTIITGADASSSSYSQIVVSHEYGTTSHWSVQSVGAYMYFADESHIYRAYLRDAVENGLVVEPCNGNIGGTYTDKAKSTDMVSVYDPNCGEIWFGMNTERFTSNARKDTALVYNLNLSKNTTEGYKDIWSGYFNGDGFEVYSLALVITPVAALTYDHRKMQGLTGTEYPYVWRGDEDGYVYICGEDEKYLDDDNYVPSEITTGAIAPWGVGYQKYAREFAPLVYERYKDAIQVQWIVDGRYELPSTAVYVELENTVPYWNDGTTYPDMKQQWNSTVWNEMPVMPVLISIDEPFNYIQFRLKCAGTNARDAIAYSGGELYYQLQGVQRPVG